MRTIVLTAPGREEITGATFARLERQNPGEKLFPYFAPGTGGKRDFWAMLHYEARVGPGDDLLILEDDIITARNFIAYARRWPSHLFTSFFNGRRRDTSRQPERAECFGFTQAIKVPARLVEQLVAGGPEAPARGRHQDDALAIELQRLGERVWYHRSLVQHVGHQSIVMPGEKLEGNRVADDFVGEDFDCLSQLQNDGSVGASGTQ